MPDGTPSLLDKPSGSGQAQNCGVRACAPQRPSPTGLMTADDSTATTYLSKKLEIPNMMIPLVLPDQISQQRMCSCGTHASVAFLYFPFSEYVLDPIFSPQFSCAMYL